MAVFLVEAAGCASLVSLDVLDPKKVSLSINKYAMHFMMMSIPRESVGHLPWPSVRLPLSRQAVEFVNC